MKLLFLKFLFAKSARITAARVHRWNIVLPVYQGPMGNHANTSVTRTAETLLATLQPVSVRMTVRRDIIRIGQRVNPVRRVMTVKQIRANRLVAKQPLH